MPSRLKQMCKANDDTRCPNLSPTCRVITSVKLRLWLHLNIHPASLCPFVPSLESSSLYPIFAAILQEAIGCSCVSPGKELSQRVSSCWLSPAPPKMGCGFLAHICWNFCYLRVQKAQQYSRKDKRKLNPTSTDTTLTALSSSAMSLQKLISSCVVHGGKGIL